MWACAAMGQRQEQLFAALRPLLLRSRLKTKEVASVLWAHATLGAHDVQVGLWGRPPAAGSASAAVLRAGGVIRRGTLPLLLWASAAPDARAVPPLPPLPHAAVRGAGGAGDRPHTGRQRLQLTGRRGAGALPAPCLLLQLPAGPVSGAACSGHASTPPRRQPRAAPKPAPSPAHKTIHQTPFMNVNVSTAQDLSNILWSFATVGRWHPVLFGAMAQEAVQRMPGFIPQELGNTGGPVGHSCWPRCWRPVQAASRLPLPLCTSSSGPGAPSAMLTLAWRPCQQQPHAPLPSTPPAVWALAKFGHIDPPLLEAIAAQVVQVPHSAHTLQELSNLLYGFAIMGHCPSSLLLTLAAEAGQRLGERALLALHAGPQSHQLWEAVCSCSKLCAVVPSCVHQRAAIVPWTLPLLPRQAPAAAPASPAPPPPPPRRRGCAAELLQHGLGAGHLRRQRPHQLRPGGPWDAPSRLWAG
jgi:hypothetical protein